MDPFTHLMSGVVLGRAWARPGGRLGLREALVGGGLAAAFPDIDYVASPFVDPLTFLNIHRGITHSLPLLPLWALLVAAVLALGWRHPAGWRRWYPLVLAALLLHVGLDVLTSYGTRLFAPFDTTAVAVPLLFIVDQVLSGGLLLALLASLVVRRSDLPALAVLSGLAVYLVLQIGMMRQAEGLAERHAQALGLSDYAISAMAQPLSPLHWKLVIAAGGEYRVALVDLGAERVPPASTASDPLWRRVDALYRPPEALQWRRYARAAAVNGGLVQAAWRLPGLAGYREFATYAYLEQVTERCAFFADLRFSLADLRTPFHYGACREAEWTWRIYRLEAGRRVPL